MEKLRIAICGGGIAGVCLAHALCKYPQFEVTIFERSKIFREDGAGVGLGKNAQAALQLISPDLRQALDNAGGTVLNPCLRFMMGTGPNTGSHIYDVRHHVPKVAVNRGPFLKEVRKLIPQAIIQMDKRIVDVHSSEASIGIRFDDGTLFEADALVGCDGISGTVRKFVLGANHPSVNPVYSRGYNHRIVIPLSEAISAFGKEYCDVQTQHGWIGEKGFLLTDLVDDGQAMQVIAGWVTQTTWPHDAPFVEWSKDQVAKDLKDWGKIGEAMTKVFQAQPKVYAAGGRLHPDTPTYCNGRMCIAGDAAQTFPPFQGVGTGQAVEDVLLLSTTLRLCKDREDIALAFEVYDALGRPRRSAIAKSSIWAAKLLTGQDSEAGLDIDRIKAKLQGWCEDIWDYDLVEAQNKAVQMMSRKLSVK